jgi:hypothetical protein
MKTKAKLPDDFLSVARRLECDENKERFEKGLAKIAKASAPRKIGSPRNGDN